jgi:hypothetical protein
MDTCVMETSLMETYGYFIRFVLIGMIIIGGLLFLDCRSE